jgi:hypothetical protein
MLFSEKKVQPREQNTLVLKVSKKKEKASRN